MVVCNNHFVKCVINFRKIQLACGLRLSLDEEVYFTICFKMNDPYSFFGFGDHLYRLVHIVVTPCSEKHLFMDPEVKARGVMVIYGFRVLFKKVSGRGVLLEA